MNSGAAPSARPSKWLGVGLALSLAVVLVGFQLPASARNAGQSADRWEDVWSTPVNLGPAINTAADESAPTLSKDRLTLYFSSKRAGGLGGNDIWVAHRASEDGPWDAPVIVTPLNSTAGEQAPALSRDAHWMFFQSSRPGGAGGTDLWVSWRRHTRDDFGWETPVNLGSIVNFQYEDFGPFLLDGDDGAPTELYFSNNRRLGDGLMDIVVSRPHGDGTFGPPELIPELCTQYNEYRPQLTANGLEIVFMSDRAGGLGGNDIWMSTRTSRFDPWRPPFNLSAVNSATNEGQPTISDDGKTLIFQAQRPGGYGGADLWMSTRTRVKVER